MLASLHPACPADPIIPQLPSIAARNTRLFLRDYAHDPGSPWSSLAELYGAAPIDPHYLISLPSFDSFPDRYALMQRAGIPDLPRSGLDRPRYSHEPNQGSCRINLPFLCADVLRDVADGFKFAMVSTPALDEALRGIQSVCSPLGLVAKCRCLEWPHCSCPKSHLARKIVNASVPGGLNDQYDDASARDGWAELGHDFLSDVVDDILRIAAQHPDERVLLSLCDIHAAHKQLKRHHSEWGCNLQRIGELILVAQGSDFGDRLAIFLFDALVKFLVHDLRVHMAHAGADSSTTYYHGDDIVVAGTESVQRSNVEHLLATGGKLVNGLWSLSKLEDWEPQTERKVWGVHLDCAAFTIAVPSSKWHRAHQLLLNFASLLINDQPLPVLEAQQLTGLLQWIGETVRPLWSLFRAFYKIMSHSYDPERSDGHVVVSLPLADKLRLLSDTELLLHVLEHEDELRVQPMRPKRPEPNVHVVSDSSFHGFCLYITFTDDREPIVLDGVWTPEETARIRWLHDNRPFDEEHDFTINLMEFLPVLYAILALEHWDLLRRGDVFCFTGDNSCVCSWIARLRARSPLAQDLLKLLTLSLLRNDATCTSQHIDGDINHLTDWGSRLEHQQIYLELLEDCGLTGKRRQLPERIRTLWSRLLGSSSFVVTSLSQPGNAVRPSGGSIGSHSFAHTLSDADSNSSTAACPIRSQILTAVTTLALS